MHQLQELVITLCEDLDTARSLSVAILVRYDRWQEAQRLKPVSPGDYLDADSYLSDHAPGELLRKLDLATERKRLKANAVDLFHTLEKVNAATNARIRPFLEEHLFIEDPQANAMYEYFMRAKKSLTQVLGKLPKRLIPRFSTGATVGDKGKLTTIPDKMSGTAQYYPSSSDVLPFWWASSWGRVCESRCPTAVRANVFFSVSKDSEKERGCAKEASINVSLQLAVALEIRDRMSRWGIDLETGKDVHMALAMEGSVTGELCTVDLSNASDTLAKSVVKLLLPEDWFMLLNSLRAPLTNVDGKLHYLEKFSSMGNGFTFELETLIFAALARALPGFVEGVDTVKVFGDDIIVSKHLARPLLAVLRFCGFTPNQRKTFLEGPFRESCGGDYFNGKLVRAHYLKKVPDEPHEWVALANGLRKLRKLLPRLSARPWRVALKQLPSSVRSCRGPESLGDLVIHDDEEHWRPRTVDHGQYRLRFFRCWSPVQTLLAWTHWRPDVQLACVTLCDSVGVATRGSVTGFRHQWVLEPAVGDQWLPQY